MWIYSLKNCGVKVNSENVGDTVGAINKKFYGFLAPSAHTGKAINKEDADFALLVMHGIVTLVTENLKMQEI